MWFVMAKVQDAFTLSSQMMQTINEIGAARRHNQMVAKSSTGPAKTADMHPIEPKIEEMRNLLAMGADVNGHDGNLLPLQCACVTGDVETVHLLLDHGANVNAADGYHRYPLHYAAEQSLPCVQLLIRNNAVVDIRDLHGNTPLHWAAYKNRADCVRCLLEAGADANALDQNADSALSWAALKGHWDTLCVLLEYNSSADTRNLSGSSPLSRLADTIAFGIGSAQEEACLMLLVNALGQLDLTNVTANFEIDCDLQRLLRPYCASPRTLQHFCRRALRHALGAGHLPSRTARLPIPQKLRNYLLLSDNAAHSF